MPVLLLFGDLCVDVIGFPATHPRPGEEATLEKLEVVNGGAAHNCALAAARAGAKVEAMGQVGDDEFGRKLVHGLRAAGVGAGRVRAIPGSRTGTVLSLEPPGGGDGDRTLYSFRGANAECYGSLPAGLVSKGDFVYLSGYSYQDAGSRETANALRQEAAGAGATCLLDPSFQFAQSKDAAEVLRGMDWITPNEREAELLTGCSTPEESAAALRSMGVANVAITLGSRGCLIKTANSQVEVTAHRLTTFAQTTGAGDAFCGGFLAALLAGCDLVEAANRANRSAAAAMVGKTRR